MTALLLAALTVPAFAPTEADILYASDRWLLFAKVDVIPSGHIVRSKRVRYYLQRVGEPDARLALDFTTRHTPTVARVLDDGTIAAHNRATYLYWIPLGAKPASALPDPVVLVDDKHVRHRIRNVYADGIVVQPQTGSNPKPLVWVPLVKRKPDWKTRLPIPDGGGFATSSPPPVYRAGNRLAFGRHVLDLKRRTAKVIPGKAAGWISAFDGKYAVDFEKIVELKGGRTIPLEYYHQVFAFRKGTAYGIRITGGPEPSRIYAIDLESGKKATLLEWKTPQLRSSRRFRLDERQVIGYHHPQHPVRVFWNREGIFVWREKHWQVLPWK